MSVQQTKTIPSKSDNNLDKWSRSAIVYKSLSPEEWMSSLSGCVNLCCVL